MVATNGSKRINVSILFVLSAMLLITISCKHKPYRDIVGVVIADTTSYFNFDTTLTINSKPSHIYIIDPDLHSCDSLTIMVEIEQEVALIGHVEKGGLSTTAFNDVDGDGNPDICFQYAQQRGNGNILFLFDNLHNTFVKVDGFDRFKEPTQLASNPFYYYSYSSAGCADMNWTSRLFTFSNFKTIELAYMYGQGCDYDEANFIKLYHVLDNSEDNLTLYQTLPMDIMEKHDGKFGFIDWYWNKNYSKFKLASPSEAR